MKQLVVMVAAALLPSALSAQRIADPGQPYLMVQPDELEWREVPSMQPPAQMSVIEGDLAQAEPFTFRLRLPDGYRLEPHTHPAYERVTVLQGTLHFAHGSRFDSTATRPLGPGSVAIMPPGAPMYGQAEGETVIQLHGVGPWGIEYVDPAHDPRR